MGIGRVHRFIGHLSIRACASDFCRAAEEGNAEARLIKKAALGDRNV